MDARVGRLPRFAVHRHGRCALLAAVLPGLPAPAAETLPTLPWTARQGAAALERSASVAVPAATSSLRSDAAAESGTASRDGSKRIEAATVSGRALGTTWTAKWLPPVTGAGPAAAAVQVRLAELLEHLERLFSTYRPDSELSRFNRSRGADWFAVSPALARVAAQARALSALTDGAFDVTVAPLLEFWGLGPHAARPAWPADAEVAAARAPVGWRWLEVRADPPSLRKARAGVAADFSSIAKGFAVDELSRRLAELGAGNHLVQIGGDLRAAGTGPEGTGWRVAIENPVLPSRTIARVLVLRDRALSTSGNYRNQVTLEGRVVGHLLDPRTGRPAGGPLAAVSVIAADCATSSALATGLFVLGADAGPALATREHLAALFLVREGGNLRARSTPGFADLAP